MESLAMLVVLTACSLLLFCQADTKPNILLVVADDLGYNDVGYHGSDIATPNIDKLSREGIRLENYYVEPTCSPTRASLMTGRHGASTGFYGLSNLAEHGVPLAETLLPERLAAKGYTNYHIGKWHLGYYNTSYVPTARGYHSFFGFHTGAMNYITKMKYATFTKRNISMRLRGYDLWQNDHVYRGSDSRTYSTHLFTQRAADTIKYHAHHKKDQPFFIHLAYQGVHSPAQAPKECIQMNPNITDKRRQLYAGMVSCLDEGLGNVTRILHNLNMWNNTIVIFTTDNGGSFRMSGSNWPLRGEKNSLFEGGMKAVGFVTSPLLPANELNRNLLHVVDWYPTIAALAGDTNVSRLDGFNIWESLRNGSEVRNELLLNLNLRNKSPRGAQATRFSAAYRDGDWKLIIGNPGRGEWGTGSGSPINFVKEAEPYSKSIWLFNIKDDPEEKLDLVFEQPLVAKKILKKVQAIAASAKADVRPPETVKADPGRHGGVWGPWNVRLPIEDTVQIIDVPEPDQNVHQDIKPPERIINRFWDFVSGFF